MTLPVVFMLGVRFCQFTVHAVQVAAQDVLLLLPLLIQPPLCLRHCHAGTNLLPQPLLQCDKQASGVNTHTTYGRVAETRFSKPANGCTFAPLFGP